VFQPSYSGQLFHSSVVSQITLEHFPQAYFNAPAGNAPVALDMGSMGKGQIWVNGHHIGRHWSYKASGSCGGCSYAGTYSEAPKCQTDCGDISQRWYAWPDVSFTLEHCNHESIP
jgi:hypothetical protein